LRRRSPGAGPADYHTIAKHAIKEIAEQQGHAATFLPKWSHGKAGSSSHVQQSLWQDGKRAFFDENDELGMSALIKNYMAGLLKYAPDHYVRAAEVEFEDFGRAVTDYEIARGFERA